MQVPCPQGSQCPGSTQMQVPQCYMSKTRRSIPGFALTKLQKETGIGERLLAGAGLMLIERESAKPRRPAAARRV